MLCIINCKNASVINSVNDICIFQISIRVFKDFSRFLHTSLWSFSRLFKALKISTLNSRTFILFRDLYEPCCKSKSRQFSLHIPRCREPSRPRIFPSRVRQQSVFARPRRTGDRRCSVDRCTVLSAGHSGRWRRRPRRSHMAYNPVGRHSFPSSPPKHTDTINNSHSNLEIWGPIYKESYDNLKINLRQTVSYEHLMTNV